jgi:mono/diheme cytochrome c family protein
LKRSTYSHKLCFLGLVLLPLIGCAAALPHATEADRARVTSRFPDATLPQLEHGRSLYVERCAGCHQLRDPGSETPLAWPHLVAEMRDDHGVHLTHDEERGIVLYLVSVSSR